MTHSHDEIMIGEVVPDMIVHSDQDAELIGRPRVAQKAISKRASHEDGDDNAYTTPQERFDLLMEMVASYASKNDQAILEKAFRFAEKAHAGQCRKSGEPFIAHPVEVAIILADLRMDVETLCAALLHDTVEDTDATSQDITDLFGEQVSQLVDGVTKISRIEVGSLTDEQAQTIRKMFVAMNQDIRVIVIKLADRLHNMRTLRALAEDRRIYKSRETLDVYAPIAHRLGIDSIKWELEDLAFFYLEPNKYKQVSRMVRESRSDREKYLSQVIDALRAEMDHVKISGVIMGRPKHLYSIYQKMMRKGKGFSEIYDLIAVRIIVKTMPECYSALGAVHSLWHPIPGRFKDYIAMPKLNMYQSLHTTVIGPAARPLEVQIRTEEMHRTSEYGVAAHWRYKENGGNGDDSLDRQLAWLREMIDWQDETSDSREFLKELKYDLAPSEVYVFTPKGEVISLRGGSTPVDFAYAIHTEVGNHCVGAKVNGSIVPLAYQLKVGDRVEILTQKSATPSRDWLSIVQTPSARSKIRSYFSKISRSDDLQLGRSQLLREMRKNGFGISNAQSTRAIKTVAEHLGYKDPDDMYVQIGLGRESAQHVTNRILKLLVDRSTEDEATPSLGSSTNSTGRQTPMLTSVNRPKHHETHSSNGVLVKGIDDVLVRLSHCCNPVPGDTIIGFVTRGRGVSVHRADCPNAKELLKSPERIIDVSWLDSKQTSMTFTFELHVQAIDRVNLLRDVIEAISDMGASITSSASNAHKDGIVDMRFTYELSDIEQARRLLQRVQKIDGVFNASREAPQKIRKDAN